MTRRSPRRPVLLTVLCGLLAAGCNPLGGSTIVAPNIPPQTSFQIVGTPGTPFMATISDTRASYNFTGVIPLSVVIINNLPPVRMVAVKLVNTRALMSLEIVSGFTPFAVSSTSEPFGSASVQLGGTLAAFAPATNPDVRFYVKAPPGELFTGLIEDQNTAYAIQATAPTLFLFESPQGSFDGFFQQAFNLGNFVIDLSVNGAVIATGIGGPTITVR
jgi:hypothetical protein